MPLGVGLIYGYWASANVRDGGPITGWNVFYGFMTVLAFTLALMAVRAVAPRLPRGIRALTWAAFAGMALGFLISTAGTGVRRSAALGLALAVGVVVSLHYRYQTRPVPGARQATEPRYPVAAGEDTVRTSSYASDSFTAHSASAPRSSASPASRTSAEFEASAAPEAPATAVRPGRRVILRRRRRGGRARLLTRAVRQARSIRRRH
jgi:hypothetical protein